MNSMFDMPMTTTYTNADLKLKLSGIRDFGPVIGDSRNFIRPAFGGIGLVVQPYLCDSPRFVRWARTHRKSRIRKKWQKRYGAVMESCKGKAYRVGDTLVVCPCMKVVLDMEFNKLNNQ